MNEIFKFKTYIDSLEAALKLKEKFYADRLFASSVDEADLREAVTV